MRLSWWQRDISGRCCTTVNESGVRIMPACVGALHYNATVLRGDATEYDTILPLFVGRCTYVRC